MFGLFDACRGVLLMTLFPRREAARNDDPEENLRFLTIAELTLDRAHMDARIDDTWLSLFPREFELLWHLAEAPGKIFTKRTLLSEIWGIDHVPQTNSLAVHIARLRAKLAEVGFEGLILTHRAGGYHLDPDFSPKVFSGKQHGLPFGLGPLDSHLRMGHVPRGARKDS